MPNGRCLTNCPHGCISRGVVMKVGSADCYGCDYFDTDDEDTNQVICTKKTIKENKSE